MVNKTLGAIILSLAAAAPFSFAAETVKPEVKQEEKQDTLYQKLKTEWEKAATKEYKVIRGDSVWKIINKTYGDGYNKIELSRYIQESNSLDEEYFKQLTAEEVVIRKSKGHDIREWIKVRKRNEALDCFILSWAAKDIKVPRKRKQTKAKKAQIEKKRMLIR